MTDISLYVDLIALCVVGICVIFYAKKGFLVALVDFVGTIAALALSVLLAYWVAPYVFNVVFRPGMEAQTAQALEEQGIENLSAIIGKMFFFLSPETVEKLLAPFDAAIGTSAAEIAARLMEEIIGPLIIPIILVCIFVVLFIVLALLARLITKLMKKAEKLPLVGMVNVVLGVVLGVLVGVSYTAIMGICLWALRVATGAPMLGNWVYEGSLLYRLILSIPLFAV